MKSVCIFYTDENRIKPLAAKYPGCEKIRLHTAPQAAQLQGRETQHIVFAAPNDELQAFTAACRGYEFASVSVLPFDNGATPGEPIPIDIRKPRLNYMETEICHVCNLNCKGCCDFSNLRVDKGFYDLDTFARDLQRMKELFWGIGKIRLMGGEPFLNPRVADHAEKCREIFPDSDLRIVSNGLLIPSVDEGVLRRLRDCGCSVDVSNYPPTAKKRKEIEKAAARAGLSVAFGIPMKFFVRTIREAPTDDPAPAFRNCLFTHCHMMNGGKLAPCSYAYCISRFNRFYGTDYPENDLFELSDPAPDGWEIIKAFSRPHEFCRYCGRGAIPYRWKGHVSLAEAKKEDWLIRDSFLNSSVVPAVQKLVKPAAVRLRAAIQRKKQEKE